jgi:4-hydroxybenzoate polyprenyltransferase
MLSPVCAWLAVRGLIVVGNPLDLMPAMILGLAILFWVAGFDIIYACQDFEYDAKKGLNSIPVRLGIPGALKLAAFCHALTILCLIALPAAELFGGPILGLGWVYWLAIVAVSGLLLYEHAIVAADDLTKVNIAFFNVNAAISIGLFLAGTIDLFWI